MIIRSSNDLQLVSCCCSIQTCPEPRQECESLDVMAEHYGWYDQSYQGLALGPDTMRYKTYGNAQRGGGKWYENSFNVLYEVFIGGKLIPPAVVLTPSQGGTDNSEPWLPTVYSDGLSIAAMLDEVAAAAAAAINWTDEEMAKGSSCSAYKNKLIPDPDNQWYGYEQTFVRYRIGVPEGFSTTQVRRSTYEAQWDEVFFPTKWTEWKSQKDSYDEAVAAHQEWQAADPETRGDEPELPDNPGSAPTPAPSLVTSRSWSWGGSMESPWSGWFDLTPPAEGNGDTRVVNMMIKCYKCARTGVAPTAVGEIYDLG